jgi:hypothetical protein
MTTRASDVDLVQLVDQHRLLTPQIRESLSGLPGGEQNRVDDVNEPDSNR